MSMCACNKLFQVKGSAGKLFTEQCTSLCLHVCCYLAKLYSVRIFDISIFEGEVELLLVTHHRKYKESLTCTHKTVQHYKHHKRQQCSFPYM